MHKQRIVILFSHMTIAELIEKIHVCSLMNMGTLHLPEHILMKLLIYY